jgi:hypothetical protein
VTCIPDYNIVEIVKKQNYWDNPDTVAIPCWTVTKREKNLTLSGHGVMFKTATFIDELPSGRK